MKLGISFLAGLANSIWSVIVSLLAVPFYLKYLGIEAYGLIGFFATLQALFHLLDMGMAPTINREVARFSALGKLHEAGGLLHTLAVIYWSLAGIILLVTLGLSSLIAEYWLQSQNLSSQTISNAVVLMGFVVAFRWPVGLYQGALIGAQRLTISSSINIVIVTIGGGGGVAVLAFISPTIEAFFIWQACVGLVLAITMRFAAWRIVGKQKKLKFDFYKLKNIWRFAAGMSGVAVSGVILMQLDKVLLSNILSLDDFGRYSLAAVIASGLYVFLTPLYNAIYPRMSALIETGDTKGLVKLYRGGAHLFLSFFFPVAISIAIFAEDLLYLWTGNQSLSISSGKIVSLFIIGTALNGLMHFPYALQLAYGKVRLPLAINGMLIVLMIPTVYIMSGSYGAVGGAAAWALTNALYVLVGTWLTHRFLLKEVGAKWLLVDVSPPLIMAIIVVGVGGTVIQGFGYLYYINLIIAGVLVLLAFIFMLLFSSRLRSVTRESIYKSRSGKLFS